MGREGGEGGGGGEDGEGGLKPQGPGHNDTITPLYSPQGTVQHDHSTIFSPPGSEKHHRNRSKYTDSHKPHTISHTVYELSDTWPSLGSCERCPTVTYVPSDSHSNTSELPPLVTVTLKATVLRVCGRGLEQEGSTTMMKVS